jgi:hypothetical protein
MGVQQKLKATLKMDLDHAIHHIPEKGGAQQRIRSMIPKSTYHPRMPI